MQDSGHRAESIHLHDRSDIEWPGRPGAMVVITDSSKGEFFVGPTSIFKRKSF